MKILKSAKVLPVTTLNPFFILDEPRYEKTPLRVLCTYEENEIKSEDECIIASSNLDLPWGSAYSTDGHFPACYYDLERNKTFFNESPNPGREDQPVWINNTYSAICKIFKGTFNKIKLCFLNTMNYFFLFIKIPII